MYKVLGMGLLALAAGCATGTGPGNSGLIPIQKVGALAPDKGVGETERIVAEIRKYHAWLTGTRQLLPPDQPGRWAKPRLLDPETLKPMEPKEPAMPSTTELLDKLNEGMKDPDFRKALKEQGTQE